MFSVTNICFYIMIYIHTRVHILINSIFYNRTRQILEHVEQKLILLLLILTGEIAQVENIISNVSPYIKFFRRKKTIYELCNDNC